MDIILGLLVLLAPVVFLWGLVSLLRRGKRKHGLLMVSTSICIIGLVGALVANGVSTEDQLKDENRPLTEPQQTTADKEELPDGWSDAETMAEAAERGIQRPQAYKLIDDLNAIDRFCKYKVQSFAIEDEQEAEMAASADANKRDAIWTDYQNKQTQLLENINSELGLIDNEFITLSNAGFWNWHCRAIEKGWRVLTAQNALDATDEDAAQAEQSLTAFYLYNLENETAHFFNKSRFSTSSCRTRQLNGNHFVACQLRSLTYQTKWQMFILGRDNSGDLVVVPINGDTRGNITGSGKSNELDAVAKARTYLEAYGEPRTYLAIYANPPLPIDEIRELFD